MANIGSMSLFSSWICDETCNFQHRSNLSDELMITNGGSAIHMAVTLKIANDE